MNKVSYQLFGLLIAVTDAEGLVEVAVEAIEAGGHINIHNVTLLVEPGVTSVLF